MSKANTPIDKNRPRFQGNNRKIDFIICRLREFGGFQYRTKNDPAKGLF